MSPGPLVFDRAEGPYLFDVDGNRLIDYYLGMGPMILGHNPPEVRRAVEAQLARGILYAGQTDLEAEAAGPTGDQGYAAVEAEGGEWIHRRSYLLAGKTRLRAPRLPGSGQRAVTTLPRV